MGAMCEICENRKDLELYIHIPFCIKKCNYCDFLSFPSSAEDREEYVRCLVKEIEQTGIVLNNKDTYQVRSVFIGGGTPSLLSGDQIKNIMQVVQKYFLIKEEAEITMEANPGTLTKKNLSAYKDAGINRLSMGLQSADNSCLYLLGRIHTWEEFLKNYELARKAGFENINIDLMSGLPGQTMSIYKKTLEKVMALRPEHISAYSLIIEEGTPFYERFAEDEQIREEGGHPRLLPEEDVERQMYELTEAFLHTKGYERYEISNYAKPGYECRHNCGYWTRKDYLGLGLGASSLVEHQRFQNTSNLKEYLEQKYISADQTCLNQKGMDEQNELDCRLSGNETVLPKKKIVLQQECCREHHIHIETLDKKSEMEEFMFLGLRLMAGISRQQFETTFQVTLDSVYGEVLRKLKSEQLIEEMAGYVRLTEHGIDVSNYVLAEFLL